MKGTINYDSLVQTALRNVIRDVLRGVANHGLVGNHHFYITFATNHPWTDIPDNLKDDYPDEMVIVLQHEFWDLEVLDDRFLVTLYFDDEGARITVPFAAIIDFVDPSVKFGLQFAPSGYEDDYAVAEDVEDKPAGAGNVVSLDDFRKK
jgi:hypothetical protein